MNKARMLLASDLSTLSRQLALVVNSDLSMQEGLSLIAEQSKSARVRGLLERTRERINEGDSLATAFAKETDALPDFYIQTVKIGEQSGNLEKVLTRIADSYDKDAKISAKVKSAVTYPLILAVLMLAVIVLLLSEVMPMFDEVLASVGGEMPGITRALMDIGRFISSYFYILLGIVALAVLTVVLMRQSAQGRERLDAFKLKIPIQRGIIRSTAAVRFARTLAMLIRSGLSFAESVRMTSSLITNTHIKAMIAKTAESIAQGGTLKQALLSLRLFPSLLLRILAVAENTGHTDDMLDQAADVMEEELDERLTRLTTVLEPALIIVLSVIIGIVLISVILPVTRIMNAVG